MAIPDLARNAAAFAFQHPTPDEVMNADDRKLERCIADENEKGQAAYRARDLQAARTHYNNVEALVDMRRPVVVKALERERGLRPE